MSQLAPLKGYEKLQPRRERRHNPLSDIRPLTSAFDELLPLSSLVRS